MPRQKKQATLKKDGYSIKTEIADLSSDKKETIYIECMGLIDDFRLIKRADLIKYLNKEIKSLEWDENTFHVKDSLFIYEVPQEWDNANSTYKDNRQFTVSIYVHEKNLRRTKYTKMERRQTPGWEQLISNSEKVIDSIKNLRESLVIKN